MNAIQSYAIFYLQGFQPKEINVFQYEIRLNVNELENFQQRHSLDDLALAKKIGVDYSLIRKLKRGKSRPGERFIGNILGNFPRLKFEKLFFLEMSSHGIQALKEAK